LASEKYFLPYDSKCLLTLKYLYMNVPTSLLNFVLKKINAKKMASKQMQEPSRSKGLKYPKSLRRKFETNHFLVKSRDVVTFIPGDVSAGHIFFLHGGAYTVEVQRAHWRFIENLLKNLSFKLSFIDYPLAPEYHYKDSHEMVFQAYVKLIELYPNDNFYFVGDSAGGGFCLSFAQTLRNKHFFKMPEKIALLSPWVDLSLSNPDIMQFVKKDLLLDPQSLLICSHNFAADIELKNPMLSPLYGDMRDLKNIGIFVGTHEILFPDCKRLKTKIEESNTPLFYKEYEGMQHDWMIFPIKERRLLLNDVVSYLRE